MHQLVHLYDFHKPKFLPPFRRPTWKNRAYRNGLPCKRGTLQGRAIRDLPDSEAGECENDACGKDDRLQIVILPRMAAFEHLNQIRAQMHADRRGVKSLPAVQAQQVLPMVHSVSSIVHVHQSQRIVHLRHPSMCEPIRSMCFSMPEQWDGSDPRQLFSIAANGTSTESPSA